ncbi:rCG50047 [Rattus norvegicus]|uniref:RCG50047 n=1 Tax=Rattus norvegicus TaxID=10116 RepID=A6JVI2_RAT|nr:rCG50047 [Rattus norvegicus]
MVTVYLHCFFGGCRAVARLLVKVNFYQPHLSGFDCFWKRLHIT